MDHLEGNGQRLFGERKDVEWESEVGQSGPWVAKLAVLSSPVAVIVQCDQIQVSCLDLSSTLQAIASLRSSMSDLLRGRWETLSEVSCREKSDGRPFHTHPSLAKSGEEAAGPDPSSHSLHSEETYLVV